MQAALYLLLAFYVSSPSDSPKDSDGLEKNARLRAERKRRSVAANIEYARISDLTRQFPEFVHKSVGPVGYFPKTTAIFPIFGHIRY